MAGALLGFDTRETGIIPGNPRVPICSGPSPGVLSTVTVSCSIGRTPLVPQKHTLHGVFWHGGLASGSRRDTATGAPALLGLLTACWHGCSKRLSIPAISIALPRGGEAECRAVKPCPRSSRVRARSPAPFPPSDRGTPIWSDSAVNPGAESGSNKRLFQT